MDNKPEFLSVDGEQKPPSNPAEQNQTINMPEKTPQQDIVDQFSVGMKPARSDSSSETFVADSTEAMRHDQVQRIQEGTKQSTDAPNDPEAKDGMGKSGTFVMGGKGNPDKRSAVNPGGLEDLSAEGIASSTETSQVRSLGVARESAPESEYHERYIAGRKVTIREEDNEKYEALLKEVSDLQKGRLLDNVPLGDPYWAKRSELDQFVGSF